MLLQLSVPTEVTKPAGLIHQCQDASLMPQSNGWTLGDSELIEQTVYWSFCGGHIFPAFSFFGWMDLLCFVYFPLTFTKLWLHVWFTVWGLSAYQFCIRFDHTHIWQVRMWFQLHQQRILVSLFCEFETQRWSLTFKSRFKWLRWLKTQQVSDTMLTVITSHHIKLNMRQRHEDKSLQTQQMGEKTSIFSPHEETTEMLPFNCARATASIPPT